MFCSKCGQQLPEGTKFCSYCGAPVGNQGTASGASTDAGASASYQGYQSTASSQAQSVYQPSAPYGAGTTSMPPVYANSRPLKDDRSLGTYIVLTIVTCGIYSWWFIHSIAEDLNAACEGDGESTPGLAQYILLSFFTCGIYNLWWIYKVGNRLAANAPRYNMRFQENGTTLLMWYIVGCLICGIGSFVAIHVMIKNSNALFRAYNTNVLGRAYS